MVGQVRPREVRALSGVMEILTSGTAVAGPEYAAHRVLFIAHPDNTNTLYLGNGGTGVAIAVDNTNGFPLYQGGPGIPLEGLRLMSEVFINGDAGLKASWILLTQAPGSPLPVEQS